jgi:hypothetical protein
MATIKPNCGMAAVTAQPNLYFLKRRSTPVVAA